MQTEAKVVVIFGGAGQIGSAVAGSFLASGARVLLTARNRERLNVLERERFAAYAAAGQLRTACADALDEAQIQGAMQNAIDLFGRIDAVFNAAGVTPQDGLFGTPAAGLPLSAFMRPFTDIVASQFLTAKAACRCMAERGSGTILMLSASIGKEARPFMAGISAACAAIEGLTRSIAAEMGPCGVSVICLRPGPVFGTDMIGGTMQRNAAAAGLPVEQFEELIRQASLIRGSVTLEEVGDMACLLTSEAARCMTGQVVNASNGLVVH